MRRLIFVSLVLFALPVHAQTASDWTFGPSVPFFTVGWDSTGNAGSAFLDAGAGVALMRNFYPNADGSLRWLTIGVPLFVSIRDTDEMTVTAGLTFGTFNNLLSVGAGVDLVNVVDGPADTGLFTGDFSKTNVKILFSFGFNIGGGSVAAPTKATLASNVPTPNDPPPCYVRMPWQGEEK